MLEQSPGQGKNVLEDYTNAVSLLLPRGKSTLIDADDYHFAIQRRWYALQRGYVVAVDGQSRPRLHRVLVNAPGGLEVDHINGNPLDNRRHNLRICTHRDNGRNTRKPKGQAGRSGPTSKYKGVKRRPHLRARPWQACIRVGSTIIHLGSFSYEDEAAAAYNTAALRHFGDFARLNVIPEIADTRPVWNGKPCGSFTSQYRGVRRQRLSKRNPWYASIVHEKQYHYLGCFPTEEAAALAYNEGATRFFGPGAFLNAVPVASPGAPAK